MLVVLTGLFLAVSPLIVQVNECRVTLDFAQRSHQNPSWTGDIQLKSFCWNAVMSGLTLSGPLRLGASGLAANGWWVLC